MKVNLPEVRVQVRQNYNYLHFCIDIRRRINICSSSIKQIIECVDIGYS